MSKKLFVYFEKILAGHIVTARGKIAFQYDTNYLANIHARALSNSLPLQENIFSSNLSEAFFQGLLPEGHAKSVIAKAHKVSSKNTYALLEELGGDCAGSIEIYSSEIAFQASQQTSFDHKTIEESYVILTSLQQRPLYFGDDGFRVSGAGAQDKLIACLVDGRVALPLHGTPSTHIFKPEINDLPQSCHNEYFCMLLAKAVGLPTPDVKLLHVKDKIFYCVNRYDRIIKNETTLRVHQEDFCQALGIAPDTKYQSDGGPSLMDCFLLLQEAGVSGIDKRIFLDMVIFNYLIGNTDAHAKNFSIIYQGKKPFLAPCYDLMSTVIYMPHYPKAKMAMKLMSQNYFMAQVTRANFAKLSTITGFREDFILKRVDIICQKTLEKAPLLVEELNESIFSRSPIYNKILEVITNHVTRIGKE